MEASRAERATSFGSVASDYDRYRPAPPLAAAEWLLPAGARVVADVAAGTGGFTRVIARLVRHVVAVELDLRMARQLRAPSPRVAVVNGRAESLPLRSGCLDAVVVCSAWHWLDEGPAVREMARVLRPGGFLGVVWGGPNRDLDWVRELLSWGREADADRPRPRRQLTIPEGMPFSEPETRVVEWTVMRTPADLVGLAGTYSRVITSTAPERQSVAARAAAVLAGTRHLHGQDSIELPMSARCWRSVRLATAD
ncbi:MAG TPA: class I SAM-dependent methyltransferase [Acidimicrobiales bacterium]|jgi:SAM-dependent methyltransferase|nr:class I SAM-dependent methyltransferase [Acidimicrobiales bacterium]